MLGEFILVHVTDTGEVSVTEKNDSRYLIVHLLTERGVEKDGSVAKRILLKNCLLVGF